MTNAPNNTPVPADPLDALLRDADGYVADDGFTARVLASLPARRRKSWLRLAILGATTMLAMAMAVWTLPPVGDILAAAVQGISQLKLNYLLGLVPVVAVLGAILWGLLEMVREGE